MPGKKMSLKKLAKKVKVIAAATSPDPTHRECLLGGFESSSSPSPATTPPGFLALYVGESRRRFLVRTGYLSHPLFSMLLEKAYDEFGFEQASGLVVPCSVSAFQAVVNAVENRNGKFDFGDLVEEFV